MALGGNTKRLFISIGLDIGRALHPLSVLRNGFNLLRSTMVATFRTSVIGGFFAVMRAGFQTITGIQQAIGNVVSEMAELQLAAIRTASVASEGGAGFADAFQQASNVARSLSTEVSFTAGQIQEGLFTAAQAGYDLNQALSFTQSSLMLAATSGEEFQTIMNDMIGITRAFGIEFEKVPQIADALAGAAQKSKVSVSGLFEGLKNVASIANVTFGESTETFVDMTAALMTLNDAGIENSKAGVKLRAAMQQINSATSKTTAVFAKYGINIFKTDSTNQRFVDTLMKSQSAFESYDEELNTLKNRQLELVVAGKQGSDEYAQTTEKIQALTEQISVLENGMDRVEDQFKLAGGQLKPFRELLKELQKAPQEALSRAFGIRGGEPIARLVQDIKNFDDNVQSVERFMEESARGVSILKNVYDKFLGSILVHWQVIKNEVVGIFSVIADAAFGAFDKLFDPIDMGLKYLFERIQANQDVFRAIFEGVAQLLSPITAQIGIALARVGEMMEEIFTPGVGVTLPVTTFNAQTGEMEQKEESLGSGATIAEKLALAVKSVVSVITAGIQKAFQALAPVMQALSKPFGDALAAYLFTKTSVFIKMGAFVAQGFIETFKQAMQTYLPAIMQFIGEELRKISVGGFHPFNREESKAPELSMGQKVASATPLGALITTAIEANRMSGQAGSKKSAAGSPARNTSLDDLLVAGFNTAADDMGIDISEINKAGAVSQQASNSLAGAGDKLVNSINTIAGAAKKLDAKATAIQKSQALKDLKGI